MGGAGVIEGGTERGSAAAGKPADEGGGRWVRKGVERKREVGGDGEEGGDGGSKQWGGGVDGGRVWIGGGGGDGSGIIGEGGRDGDGNVAEENAVKGPWGSGETVEQRR